VGRKNNPVNALLPLSGKAEMPWLWIGTWSMGGVGFGPHNEREAKEVLQRAFVEGFTHFDTAPVYGNGLSETLLAQIVSKNRTSVFLCTKGGLRYKNKRIVHDARPEALSLQIRESLKRLKTDYLDLYLLHWKDPEVSLSESIDALKMLQKEGLTRFWGVSNLTVKELEGYLRNERNIPHQLHFSLLCKNYSLLESSSRYCINCIYSPLEQGLLTDSSVSEGIQALSRRDIRRRNPHFNNKRTIEWVKKLKALCRENSLPTSMVVLLWTGSQSHVHAIVVGPRKMAHFKEIMQLLGEANKKGLFGTDKIFNQRLVKDYLGESLWSFLEEGA